MFLQNYNDLFILRDTYTIEGYLLLGTYNHHNSNSNIKQ